MLAQTGRLFGLLILGVAALFFLAACSAATPWVTGGEAPSEVDTAVVTVVKPKAEQGIGEPAAADSEDAGSEVAAPVAAREDDRPARLRSATGGWNTDWTLRSIEYDELLSGGPPRDGIPPIDRPVFVSFEKAAEWLADNEPVISLEVDGQARAYPLQILTWHEIVNDEVGGVPVAVTFCPLCNSAITFDRRLDGQVLDFGTSGLLRNSDLVMWDRATESLWQQFTGEGIVGEMTGKALAFLPSSIVSFADFRQAFPDGIVLSRRRVLAAPTGAIPTPAMTPSAAAPFSSRARWTAACRPWSEW